jgi:hypothetical protein
MQKETARHSLFIKSQFHHWECNICVEEELSNNEFEKIVKMTNDLKKEAQKLVFDLKEDVNK